jgi:hypothetical protein
MGEKLGPDEVKALIGGLVGLGHFGARDTPNLETVRHDICPEYLQTHYVATYALQS